MHLPQNGLRKSAQRFVPLISRNLKVMAGAVAAILDQEKEANS